MALPVEPREPRLKVLQGTDRVKAAAVVDTGAAYGRGPMKAAAVVEARESGAARGGGDVVAAAEALGGHRAAVVRRTLRLHTAND